MNGKSHPIFAYVRGVTGNVQPQKWAENDFGVGSWKLTTIVAQWPITEEEFAHVPLSTLARLYPCPTQPRD